jgi:hypothetical protein
MLGAILEQIENDKFSFWVKKTLAAEDGIYACCAKPSNAARKSL